MLMNRRQWLAGLADLVLCGVALTWLPQAAGETNRDLDTAQPISPSAAAASGHETLSLRGRVVWLADALQQLHGIQTVPEARDRVLVLQTDDGELHPLVRYSRPRIAAISGSAIRRANCWCAGTTVPLSFR